MKENELTLNNCFEIIEQYAMPNNILEHCKQVSKISLLIGKKYFKKGKNINIKFLTFSALLHDLLKVVEIKKFVKDITVDEIKKKTLKWDELREKYKNVKHEEAFYLEFHKDLPTISKYAKKHLYEQINIGLDCDEEKILYYSDKLVMHDKITTLKNRLDEGHKRYMYNHMDNESKEKFVNDTDKKIVLLESEIFKITGLNPTDLIALNDISFENLIKKEFEGEL